jgi:putative transposase
MLYPEMIPQIQNHSKVRCPIKQHATQKVKSITAGQIFKEYPEIKKQLLGGEFWSDGGYTGTVGDGTTSDVIKNYVENQGNKEEIEEYQQMKIFDF